MSQPNGAGGFQVLHFQDEFSEDEVDKRILNILALYIIFHGNPHFVNYGNGFMHTLNERGIQTRSFLHISYKVTLHLTLEPCRLVEIFITIQNAESGSLLILTFLDGESFQFYCHWWEQGKIHWK